MSFPNQFPQQPPQPQAQTQAPQQQQQRFNHFAVWVQAIQSRAAQTGQAVDRNKVIAAGMAMEALEAAVAVGMTVLPNDKFSTANAVELAKLITDIEFNLRNEITDETPDDGAEE